MKPLGWEHFRPDIGASVKGSGCEGTPFRGKISEYLGPFSVRIDGIATPIGLLTGYDHSLRVENMQFKLPCETYIRLHNAAKPSSEDKPKHLYTLLLENHDGILVAVATNNKILAVEKIGSTDQPNGSVNIIFDPMLLHQCSIEPDGELTIFVIDNAIMQHASVKTSGGYVYPGNIAMFGEFKEWSTWRSIFPDQLPNTSFGFMYLQGELMANLAASAPSGSFVFPEHIDTRQPVLVNDPIDRSWIGLFMAICDDVRNMNYEPAEYPRWLK